MISSHAGYARHGAGVSAGRFTFWQIAFDSFMQSPIAGSGPGTYPRFYLEALPGGVNGWISPHAHNIIFDTASSLGILGLFALSYIVFTFIYVCVCEFIHFRVNSKYQVSTNQGYIIGGAAALSGFLVQSLVDRLTAIPHAIIPIMLILALFVKGLNLLKKGRNYKFRYSTILLVLPVLVLIITIRINQAQDFQIKSLQSNYHIQWNEATSYLDTAKEIDQNLNFYNEQRGYSHGALALSNSSPQNRSSLNEAIKSYELANENYPYWAPNYVNLAQLLKESGKPEQALITLESIPSAWLDVWAFPNLLLAEKYQSLGDISKAENLYRKTLNKYYWVRDIAICKQSKTCQEIAAQIQIEDKDDYSIHQEVTSLIDRGSPDQALELLKKSPFGGSSSQIWVDRAATHLALGEIPQTEYALLVAEKLNVINRQDSAAFFALTKANLLLLSNNDTDAIETLESIVRPIIRFRYYENILYQRIGFPDYLLPSLAILEKNYHDYLIYLKLAELYEKSDRLADADWASNQASILSNLLGTD